MAAEAVLLTVGDFPADIGAYPRIFHNLDVCKDAEQARVAVTLTHTPGGTTLFENAIKALGFAPCKGYKSKLEKFEDGIQKGIDADKAVIQKQINRLETPQRNGKPVKDTGLPLSIKLAIRDSGANADTFRADIKYLEVPSDYSDPATRTPLLGRAPRFPRTGVPFRIGPDVFSMMLGNDVIKGFSAVIGADNSCVVSFAIDYAYKGVTRQVAYATHIGANYTHREPVMGEEFKDASDFFQGNPEKNTHFNNNQSAWILRKSVDEQAATLGDAVSYLACKEFFGDVLIALIGMKYKAEGSKEGQVAVFTSDNALKSLCSLLKVDYVAKNWGGSATEEAVACLFSPDPVAELEAGKAKIVADTIAWNERLVDMLSAYIVEGNELNGVGNIKKVQVEFVRVFFVPYLMAINEYLRSVPVNDARSIKEFREDIIRYQVKNVIKEVRGDVVSIARGIYDPFKYVPREKVPPPAGFPEINTEFLVFLQRFRGVGGPAVPAERLQLGRRRMRGGAKREGAKREGAQRGGVPLEDAVDKNPTETLKVIIKNVLEGFELADVLGRVDVEDIYNLLFSIYDIDCRVCFNEQVIYRIVEGILYGIVPNMGFEETRSKYNDMLNSYDRALEEDIDIENDYEVAKYAPIEEAILRQEMAGRLPVAKAMGTPGLKRMTAKQQMFQAVNSAQKGSLRRRNNQARTAKRGSIFSGLRLGGPRMPAGGARRTRRLRR